MNHKETWTYHESLIPNSLVKPLRVWLEVGERDNGATSASSGLHNWLIAKLRMAKVLKAKGYHYQFIYAKTPATPRPGDDSRASASLGIRVERQSHWFNQLD